MWLLPIYRSIVSDRKVTLSAVQEPIRRRPKLELFWTEDRKAAEPQPKQILTQSRKGAKATEN